MRKKVCSYLDCGITGRTKRTDSLRYKLFHFPQDDVLCDQWIAATGNEDLYSKKKRSIKSNYFICEKHFKKSQFQIYISPNRHNSRLKAGSVPISYNDSCDEMEIESQNCQSDVSDVSSEILKIKEEEKDNADVIDNENSPVQSLYIPTSVINFVDVNSSISEPIEIKQENGEIVSRDSVKQSEDINFFIPPNLTKHDEDIESDTTSECMEPKIENNLINTNIPITENTSGYQTSSQSTNSEVDSFLNKQIKTEPADNDDQNLNFLYPSSSLTLQDGQTYHHDVNIQGPVKEEPSCTPQTKTKKKKAGFLTSKKDDKIVMRDQIITMWKAGREIADIMSEIGCSRSTVWKWIDRYQEEQNLAPPPITTNKPQLTPRQMQLLIEYQLKNPHLTILEVIKPEPDNSEDAYDFGNSSSWVNLQAGQIEQNSTVEIPKTTTVDLIEEKAEEDAQTDEISTNTGGFGKSKSKGEETSVARRHKIINLWKAGREIEDIIKEVGCCRGTVWRWVDRYIEKKDLSTKPKTGMKPKLTPEQDKIIIQYKLDNPNITALEIRNAEGWNVSADTVRKRIKSYFYNNSSTSEDTATYNSSLK